MSSLSVNATSFAASLSPIAAAQLEENEQVSEEIVALQDRFNEEFSVSDAEEGEDTETTRRITDFVSDQLLAGDNSDEAVAFLLNLANQEQNPRDSLQGRVETQLSGSSQNFSNREPTLTEVLDLANETFRQLRESNAPIGLQLSVISETFEGLQDIRA